MILSINLSETDSIESEISKVNVNNLERIIITTNEDSESEYLGIKKYEINFSLNEFVKICNLENVDLFIEKVNIIESNDELLNIIIKDEFKFKTIQFYDRKFDNISLLKYELQTTKSISKMIGKCEINEDDIFDFYDLNLVQNDLYNQLKLIDRKSEIYTELRKMFLSDVTEIINDKLYFIINKKYILVRNKLDDLKIFGSSMNFLLLQRGCNLLSFA